MAEQKLSEVAVALLGAGTVGGGVLQMLRQNRAAIEQLCRRKINLVAVVARDVEAAKRRFSDGGFGDDIAAVLSDAPLAAVEKADIIIELMGGETTAAECITAALAAGKPVITANKSLLATAGDSLFALAQKTPLRFEAAVGGCIPIIRTLNDSLAGDTIEEVCGIINGTCNDILSAMATRQLSFADALADAQKQGFAEADPTLDISGLDCAHKLALICRLAFGAAATVDDIAVCGIDDFDGRDIQYAARFGFCVKLLATAKKTGGGLELSVQPSLVAKTHLLSSVNGAMNAVVVRSVFAGETIYIGAGAGAKPTAAAVVADLIDIIRNNNRPTMNEQKQLKICPPQSAPYYVRLQVFDRPGVLAEVTRILAAQKISIEAILQNDSLPEQEVAVTMLLHETGRKSVDDGIAQIQKLPTVIGKVVTMPIVG